MDRKGVAWTIVGALVVLLAFAIIMLSINSADLQEVLNQTIDDNKIPPGGQPIECYDDDGGRNYFTEGSINGNVFDSCDPSEGKLKEYYCGDVGEVYVEYYCPLGCDGNACNSSKHVIENCEDSDGGRNFFQKGTVTDVDTSDTYEDYCGDEIFDEAMFVHEYFCQRVDHDTAEIRETVQRCLKGCELGECIP